VKAGECENVGGKKLLAEAVELAIPPTVRGLSQRLFTVGRAFLMKWLFK
jgi:hypothetical protein